MKGKVIWGFLFIILGVIFLINSIFGHEFISASDLWPFIVLALGLSFEISYFNNRKDPGVLVPGGILTVLGFLFIFETFTNWNFSGYTYPIYTLSVAIGLFQLYLFGEKKGGLLIPVFILTAVSVFQYLSIFYKDIYRYCNSKIIFAVILIFIGCSILYNNIKKQ
ncbi:MAG: hypothetical protein LIR50_11395 [Bacillota bacterium]|nr:hypothetical protein [Bacillota bacterium]